MKAKPGIGAQEGATAGERARVEQQAAGEPASARPRARSATGR